MKLVLACVFTSSTIEITMQHISVTKFSIAADMTCSWQSGERSVGMFYV